MAAEHDKVLICMAHDVLLAQHGQSQLSHAACVEGGAWPILTLYVYT